MKINKNQFFFAALLVIVFCSIQTPVGATTPGTIRGWCTMEQVDDCTVQWYCSDGTVYPQFTDHDHCPLEAQEVDKAFLQHRNPRRH